MDRNAHSDGSFGEDKDHRPDGIDGYFICDSVAGN
jgi:hypothetical protein